MPNEPPRPSDGDDGPDGGRERRSHARGRWPLSPWELARGVDADARALGADPRDAPSAQRLVAVGGTVLLRCAVLVLLAGALVPVLPAGQTPWVAGAGLLGAVAYGGSYLRASVAAARHALLGSLRRGYRVSLFLLVLAAAVTVRAVGARVGWVAAEPRPPWPGWFAGAAIVAVRVQTRALRRRT